MLREAGERESHWVRQPRRARLAGWLVRWRRGREVLTECGSPNLAAKSQLSAREAGEAERGKEGAELSQCSFHPSEGGEGASGRQEGAGG